MIIIITISSSQGAPKSSFPPLRSTLRRPSLQPAPTYIYIYIHRYTHKNTTNNNNTTDNNTTNNNHNNTNTNNIDNNNDNNHNNDKQTTCIQIKLIWVTRLNLVIRNTAS